MIYPFQTEQYRSIFKKHFVTDIKTCILYGDVEYEILPDKRAVLLGMKPVLNGQEVTDYGDMSNPSKETVQAHLRDLYSMHAATSVQYDYIREDSSLFHVLSEISTTEPTQQEVSPFITLPSMWDQYLEMLERTDRKELKRKWKRLDTVPHEFRIFEYSKPDRNFEMFIKLHKLSDHSKGLFMTPPMEQFFADLFSLNIPGWKQKLAFLFINDKSAASVFYFENDEELLLYNSGYDPEFKQYSGGLLLSANLIKQAIENGKKKFDFLRGNERYKHDLGGKDMPLYKFYFTKSTSA